MVDFAKLLAETKAKSPIKQEAVKTDLRPSAVESALDLGIEDNLPEKETTYAPVAKPTSVPAQQNEPAGSVSQSPPAASGAVIDYPGLHELKDKIYALENAMKANHPAMDSLLQAIHRNLSKDPELVHILKPEDRAVIFQGLQKKTQTKIVEEKVKSASSGRNKGLKNIGLEDM